MKNIFFFIIYLQLATSLEYINPDSVSNPLDLYNKQSSFIHCNYSLHINKNLLQQYSNEFSLGVQLNNYVYRESIVPITTSTTNGLFTISVFSDTYYEINPVLIHNYKKHNKHARSIYYDNSLQLYTEHLKSNTILYQSSLKPLKITSSWKTLVFVKEFFYHKDELYISISLPFQHLYNNQPVFMDAEILIDNTVLYSKKSIRNHWIFHVHKILEMGKHSIQIRVKNSKNTGVIINYPQKGTGFEMGRSIFVSKIHTIEKRKSNIIRVIDEPINIEIKQIDGSTIELIDSIYDNSQLIELKYNQQLPKIYSLITI